MRIFAGILTMILTMTLAITIGNRISPELVAMAAGVALGATAALPLSLVVGVAAQRRQPAVTASAGRPPMADPPLRSYSLAESYASGRDYPPLVIINPSAFTPASRPAVRAAALLDSTPMLSGPRQFRVVGDEAT